VTLLGTWVDEARALLWCDSETYGAKGTAIEGQPAGHVLKLAVNRKAGVAAALAGNVAGTRRMRNAVEFVNSFDEFSDGIATYLKAERRELSGEFGEYADDLPGWTCVAAGWSRRCGRMVGMAWSSSQGRPIAERTFGYALPYVDGFYTLHPNEPADILSLAQSQMREVRKIMPSAGEGTLTIATVRRDDITVALFDIPSGRPLSALPENLADGVLSMRASAGDGPRCPSRDSQREPAAEPRSSAAGTSP